MALHTLMAVLTSADALLQPRLFLTCLYIDTRISPHAMKNVHPIGIQLTFLTSLIGQTLPWQPQLIISSYDYSMIVATAPEPTVCPPSRYQTGVLRCTNGDFSCDSCGKIQIFRYVCVVFRDFVIMVLSHIIQFSNFANNNSSLYRLYGYL